MSIVLSTLVGIDTLSHSHSHIDGATGPLRAPDDYIGPLSLPGTGRMVWWTGRVAIGLRYQPTRGSGPGRR